MFGILHGPGMDVVLGSACLSFIGPEASSRGQWDNRWCPQWEGSLSMLAGLLRP